jgi:hypothetical protein
MQLCDFLADLLHHLADLSIHTHAVSPNRCGVRARSTATLNASFDTTISFSLDHQEGV